MTKQAVIRKLEQMSVAEFARVAPFLEADLASSDDLAALHREVRAGRRSARMEPLLKPRNVYARVRKKLAR